MAPSQRWKCIYYLTLVCTERGVQTSLTMKNAEFVTNALWWGDFVMLGSFFVMQKYLTDVWKVSFTYAATFLNIWGGIYRILPLSLLFLADTTLGNFVTLALSGILSTTGLVVVTVITGLGYGCRKKGESECVGPLEKGVFIMGMALIALGRAARFASAKPFIKDQKMATDSITDHEDNSAPASCWSQISSVAFLVICFILFVSMPVAAFFAFPHIKRWYLLFGVSAVCTAFATLLYLISFREYQNPGPTPEGSPVTDIVRVFVAAAFNKSQPSPTTDDPRLHTTENEEFTKLSTSRCLGFLHKAAIKLDGVDVTEQRQVWKLCSVSEVESAKILIRMVLVYMMYLMGGIVFSIGNTYLVEQATHMNYNIGSWKPPLQLLQLLLIATKVAVAEGYYDVLTRVDDYDGEILNVGFGTTFFSIICCTVAAAIERRRVHSVRGHNLVDGDAKVPMGAYWLLFQAILVGVVQAVLRSELITFHKKEAPKSMKRYRDCLVEGVIGLGFMCGAISVYVVGKVSQMGSGKGWFQHKLNKSRLDRYYWVLSVLATLNLILSFVVSCNYRTKTMLRITHRPRPKPRLIRRRRRTWASILMS